MGTRDDQDKILLTADEAAEYLNASRATVYRLIKRGVLEKVKIAGIRHWFLSTDNLDAYALATNVTLPELASRLLKAEKKIEFLLTRGNSGEEVTPAEVKTTTKGFTEVQKEIQRRFPRFPKN